jgi:hypothetical protein
MNNGKTQQSTKNIINTKVAVVVVVVIEMVVVV